MNKMNSDCEDKTNMEASTNSQRTEKIHRAGPPSASKVVFKGIDDLIQNLDPNRETFFVKKGRQYKGVYFPLDFMVPFTDADCINDAVTQGHEINLQNLEQIFKKCKMIENLKFFGVTITNSLMMLIANHCPNLKNLELNPCEDRDAENTNDCDGISFLVEKCKDLENIIIRNLPTGNLENTCNWDKVDRNFFFCTGNSYYDINCFAHQNITKK